MSNSSIGLFIFGSALFVMGVVFLMMAIMLAFFEKPGSGYATSSGIVAFIFAVIFCMISDGKIKELAFEFIGLKTQIKKAEEVIKEANATIEQLKELGLVYAEPSFNNLALAGNMMVGMTGEAKVEMREKLATSLKKLGIVSSQIDEAAKNFDEMFDRYHRNKFLGSLTEEMKRTLPQENLAPERVRVANLTLSPESKELLEDWEFFQKNKKLRRPELWREHYAG